MSWNGWMLVTTCLSGLSTGVRAERPEGQPWWCNLPTVRHWVRDVSSVSLIFFICKKGIRTKTSIVLTINSLDLVPMNS